MACCAGGGRHGVADHADAAVSLRAAPAELGVDHKRVIRVTCLALNVGDPHADTIPEVAHRILSGLSSNDSIQKGSNGAHMIADALLFAACSLHHLMEWIMDDDDDDDARDVMERAVP
jgi:hypothetical protein